MKKTLAVLLILVSAQSFAATSAFKMYRSMYPKVTSGCDIYTELKMNEENGVVTEFTLTNKVGGFCEIYVEPNPRTYKVEVNSKYVDGGCKSVSYVSKSDDLTVNLLDHRKRVCENPVPNLLVVTLLDYEGQGQRFYSINQ